MHRALRLSEAAFFSAEGASLNRSVSAHSPRSRQRKGFCVPNIRPDSIDDRWNVDAAGEHLAQPAQLHLTQAAEPRLDHPTVVDVDRDGTIGLQKTVSLES